MANTFTLTQTGQQVQDILDGMASAAHARNFLINGYLLNPVNQKDGHFSAAGVTFYSDAACTSSMGATANIHALTPESASAFSFAGDDTDGTSGTTYYVKAADASSGYFLTSGEYSVDGWKGNLNGLLVEITASGVTVTNTGSSNARFQQLLEPNVRALMAGKDMTLSALIGGTVYSATGTIPAGTNTVTIKNTTVATGVTLSLAASGASITAGFILTAGKSVTIEGMKLELGVNPTIAYDPAPDPEVELARCQRYLIQVMNSVANDYFGYVGYAYSTSYAAVFIPIPATLYSVAAGTRPSLSDTTAPNWTVKVGNTAKTITAVDTYFSGSGTNGVFLRISGSFAAGDVVTLRYAKYAPVFISSQL